MDSVAQQKRKVKLHYFRGALNFFYWKIVKIMAKAGFDRSSIEKVLYIFAVAGV